LGNEIHNVYETRGALGASTSTGDPIGADLEWSRGLRLEFSPIKTRSARKRQGTKKSFSTQLLDSSLDQRVIRGMKALAQAKS